MARFIKDLQRNCRKDSSIPHRAISLDTMNRYPEITSEVGFQHHIISETFIMVKGY